MERAMPWADLDWPQLSPEFPEPRIEAGPPPRPPVPVDIAEQVRRAEVRRAWAVRLCVLAGALLFAAGCVAYVRDPRPGGTPIVALTLIGGGLSVAFALAAVLALLVGPNWTQRQQHWRLQHWQAERAAWLARKRGRYLASLSPAQRERLRRRLGAR
jgi:hypothetical protein